MKRSSWMVASLAALGLLLGGWVLLFQGRRLPKDPLEAVPYDAIGFVRLRLDRWLASDAVRRVLVERGKMRGIERIRHTCGFDPLHGLREVVLFARPNHRGKRPKVALSARGHLDHTELMRCVGKLGRSGFDGLVREEVHGIQTIRSENGTVRAAFVGADGLLVGDADSVSAAIAAIVGAEKSAKQDALLAPLYRELDSASDLALVARSAGNEAALTQALSDLGLTEISANDLRALSASAELRDAFAGRAAIITVRPEVAQRLVAQGERLRTQALGFPVIGLTAFAKPLRELRLQAVNTRATIEGAIALETLAAAFDVVPAFVALQRQLGAAKDGPPAGARSGGPPQP